MSSALIWEIVKKSNAFAVRGETGSRPRFSRERGNLKGVHSFKYSGLANDKTVDVSAAPGGGIAVTVSRPKNAAKPAKARHTTVAKTGSAVRAAAGAGAAAASLRPDLKRAAAARASALARAARAAKAAAKAAPAAAAETAVAPMAV